MWSHYNFKTFYFEYFYAYMGTATCRAFAKILELLHHVCFTFSDNQPTLHSHNIKWHSISSGFALLFFGNPRNEIKMNALSPKLLKLGTINSSEMFQHRYGLNLVYYIYLHILQNWDILFPSQVYRTVYSTHISSVGRKKATTKQRWYDQI